MASINKRLADYVQSIHKIYPSTKYFEVFEQDIPYQKYWRKKMNVSFSKREVYELARPLAHYQNKSIYAAKLEIGQLEWWDYGYLANLISFIDPAYSKKIDYQFEVIWYGGISSYCQSQDSEYEKQLLAWGDELFTYGDSSKVDQSKYPALNQDIPENIMEYETNEALTQFVHEFIEWLKKHPDFQIVVARFWQICASHMAKDSYSLNADLYSKQMKRAGRALLDHNWDTLKNELMNITSWWD